MSDTNVQIFFNGPTRVVDEGALERLTESGWRLLRVLEDEELAGAEPAYFNHTSGRQVEAKPGQLRRRIRFLVGHEPDAALAEMAESVARAEGVADAARDQAFELDDKLTKLRREHEELKAVRDLLVSQRDSLFEQSSKNRETIGAMERDLAAIRRVVGTERFAELVGHK